MSVFTLHVNNDEMNGQLHIESAIVAIITARQHSLLC